MMQPEGHLQAFSAWHEDAGEVVRGGVLTREQGERFGTLFLEKLMELHAQTSLSEQEIAFLEDTVQTTSMIIRYLFEAKHFDPPRDKTMIQNVANRAEEILSLDEPGSVNVDEWPDSEVQKAVTATALVAARTFKPNSFHEMRRLVEGYGVASTYLLATMLRDNGGVAIDTYLLEKMQIMAVAFDKVDRK